MWIPNQLYWLQRRVMLMLCLSVSEAAAAATLNWDEAQEDFEKVTSFIESRIAPRMKVMASGKNFYEGTTGGMDQWLVDRLELQSRLTVYLTHFAAVSDDLQDAMDLFSVGLTYAAVIKYLNQTSPIY